MITEFTPKKSQWGLWSMDIVLDNDKTFKSFMYGYKTKKEMMKQFYAVTEMATN